MRLPRVATPIRPRPRPSTQMFSRPRLICWPIWVFNRRLLSPAWWRRRRLRTPSRLFSSISPIGTVTAQQTVTITGTATDAGGLVAGVEVSTDGGATWHPAVGTGTWSYAWWSQSPGQFQILSRAVDDSLNLETPGPGISVTVNPGPPSACSILLPPLLSEAAMLPG